MIGDEKMSYNLNLTTPIARILATQLHSCDNGMKRNYSLRVL